jgi:hypothetical protein
MSTNYILWVGDRGDWGITKRTEYQFPGPNHSYLNEEREYIVEPSGSARWPARAHDQSNKLMVEVGTSNAKFYINDELVHTLSSGSYMNEIRSLKKIGIWGGNWEWGDTDIGFDWFFVDEGCDTY